MIPDAHGPPRSGAPPAGDLQFRSDMLCSPLLLLLSSQVSLQLVAQKGARTADARFNCTFARLQDRRDFLVAFALDIAQHERRAILVGQRTDGPRHSRPAFLIDEGRVL